MRVFLFAAKIRSITETELDRMRSGLPEFQQKRFNIKYPGSLFAWLLLKKAIEEIYGMETLPECIKPESGKPYFEHRADIHFSLSHNDSYAVCAISDASVGCDIESTSRKPAKILFDKVVTPLERDVLSKSDDPDREFMRLWTMKEAKLKKDGTGLSGGIGKTDVSDILAGNMVRPDTGEFFSCFEFEGNYITVCAEDTVESITGIEI